MNLMQIFMLVLHQLIAETGEILKKCAKQFFWHWNALIVDVRISGAPGASENARDLIAN